MLGTGLALALSAYTWLTTTLLALALDRSHGVIAITRLLADLLRMSPAVVAAVLVCRLLVSHWMAPTEDNGLVLAAHGSVLLATGCAVYLGLAALSTRYTLLGRPASELAPDPPTGRSS